MLYSYVVARDYGFAPNPFGGYCTLATCKPKVRKAAQVGDWIVGTGSKGHARKTAIGDRRRHLVFVMQVAEALTFNQYWNDPRFQIKKPIMAASLKIAYGDNIYHSENGVWLQANSHHSLADGSINTRNVANDTQTNRMLMGTRYAYWGQEGPEIPADFLNFAGSNLCTVRGHKCHFPEGMEEAFINWFIAQQYQGYLGRPLDW